MRNVLFDDRGATLLSTVQLLPALTELDIYGTDGEAVLIDPVSDDNGLPRCRELAELHSRSLTWLRVCMIDGPADGNVLRLKELPQLRSVELNGHLEYPPIHMRIDAASFEGTPKLQNLHLQDDRGLVLQDGSLQQLTALTALRLLRCNLHSIPADLASVGMTLRVLDMSLNRQLRVSHSAAASILQCSRLEKLGMHGPTHLDIDTVEHLLMLPLSFQKQHRRDLDIFFDEASYLKCSDTDLGWPPDDCESSF